MSVLDTSLAVQLCQGNPGALSVILRIIKEALVIDPQGMPGDLRIYQLDDLEIRGSDIWLLYKDICGEDLRLMIGVLRAWQLGLLSREDLKRAIHDTRRPVEHPFTINVGELVGKVEEELPEFLRAGDSRP